jgi:UDP-glucose:(heptosyl)LPS alpha-1,3-glucosyltransferase
MKLALLLFRWFPHGGLQRDCLAIAKALAARGHQVEIVCGAWDGPRPAGIAVRVLGFGGLTNHGRNRRFAARAAAALARDGCDRVVGFDRMPGLDVYYAADRCFVAEARAKHGIIYRLTPRHRAIAAFERAVFGRDAATHVLLLHEKQAEPYQAVYGTQGERLHVLPPSIARDRVRPTDADAQRAAARAELGLADDQFLLLLIASRYRTKGVDRAIAAVAALAPALRARASLLVIGSDDRGPYEALARRLGVDARLIDGRDDIVRFLCAADLMLHPARAENTGTVLLEALLCGLPVLCAGVCGFAPHVARAEAGIVLDEPYDEARCAQALGQALDRAALARWSANALAYARARDLHGGIDEAVRLIETLPRVR